MNKLGIHITLLWTSHYKNEKVIKGFCQENKLILKVKTFFSYNKKFMCGSTFMI